MSASVFRYKTSFPSASDGAAKLFALRKLNRKLYMALDAAVPFVIFLGYFLVHNSWLIPHNLAQFMALGVNLKHALLLVFTTCTWWGIFLRLRFVQLRKSAAALLRDDSGSHRMLHLQRGLARVVAGGDVARSLYEVDRSNLAHHRHHGADGSLRIASLREPDLVPPS